MARKKTQVSEAAEAAEKMLETCAISPPDYQNGLSTGAMMLNLALTNHASVGWIPGSFNHFVGASDSGKTFFALTAFAEAARNPVYDGYRFVYDNPEHGAQMDVVKLFGAKMAARLRPPAWVGGVPRYSDQVEEFFYYALSNMDEQPCVYILDSFDALSSAAEESQAEDLGVAVRRRDRQEEKGEDASIDVKGSYGDGKAKVASAFLRQLISRVFSTKSIFIVISQEKEDVKSPYGGKRYSGGKSLRFYSHTQVWAHPGKKLVRERSVGDNKVRDHIGNTCHFVVERSRYTGRKTEVEIPIYSSGIIDDVGSVVDYLCREGVWKKSGANIKCADWDFSGTREGLVELIERECYEPQLAAIVEQTWRDRLADLGVIRKKRYE